MGADPFFNVLHALEEMSFLPVTERSHLDLEQVSLYPSPNVNDLWVVRWPEFVSDGSAVTFIYNRCIEPRFWKNTIYTTE